MARGHIVGWILIGAAGLLPVAGAIAFSVEPPRVVGQEVVSTATAEAESYQRGSRDTRKARLEVRARGGVPGAPERAPAADEHPYIRGSYDESVAEDKGETVIMEDE
jgi:hypothetical protein